MPDDIFMKLMTADDQKLLFPEQLRPVSYQRGNVLFREGQDQPNLYVVRQGLVRVERNYQGQPIAVARYGPGEVLGEVAFLTDQRAHGTAVAEEAVEVDVIDGRRLLGLLTSDSGFASRFYQSLALCLGDRLVQILPGIKLPEALGGHAARPRLQRTGQVSAQQVPAELVEKVAGYRDALAALAAQLTGKPLERTALVQAQEKVNEACDGLVSLLNEYTSARKLMQIAINDLDAPRDYASLSRGIGGYVFRETFPFFMLSTTIAQAYEQRHGRAEDHDLLVRIENADLAMDSAEGQQLHRPGSILPDGDGTLGPLIDRWFLGRPLCQARRNSARLMTSWLREGAAGSGGPVRLTSLAAGTAQEVFDLLASTPQHLYLTCLDADTRSLVASSDRARQLGCAERITFMQADLLAIVGGKAFVRFEPQQVIYGLGVCDYLHNDRVVAVLDWIHSSLAPGGWVVLTNRDAASPNRAFVEHILDWPVNHRTQEEFGGLFVQSAFKSPPEIVREDTGVNLFARCRKN
jgi:CRP-like cAMP-binding protein